MPILRNNKLRLPIFFKPNFKTDLVRIGKKNDGGYCISKLALKETSILYSFGLSDDWSFEKEFREKSGSKVICFDHSVTLVFWFKRLIKDLLQFFSLKELNTTTVKRFFTFFSYHLFFNNSDVTHVKKFFGPSNQMTTNLANSQVIDMNTILKQWNNKNCFMKVDIEGSEYRILDQIIEHQNKLTGLTIEFHDCDLMCEKIKLFIQKFNLDLVHIHVNNYGIVTKDNFPTVIELTFSPNSQNLKRESAECNFPVRSFDQPNDKSRDDLDIVFYD